MKNDAAVALRSLFTNACTTMYGILKELWYKEQVTKKSLLLAQWLVVVRSLQCVRANLTCYRFKGPVGCIKSNGSRSLWHIVHNVRIRLSFIFLYKAYCKATCVSMETNWLVCNKEYSLREEALFTFPLEAQIIHANIRVGESWRKLLLRDFFFFGPLCTREA